MNPHEAIYWFGICQVAGFIIGLTYSIAFHWGTWD